jgi:hypothetical protein
MQKTRIKKSHAWAPLRTSKACEKLKGQLKKFLIATA